MVMTLDLLDKTFTDIETIHTIKEAEEKGKLFFKCVQSIKGDLDDDYWLQVARGWDLNFFERGNHYYMSIYRVKDYAGSMVTDTNSPVTTILLDTREVL